VLDLHRRAKIKGHQPKDGRKTFGTMVEDACRDHALTRRLMRHDRVDVTYGSYVNIDLARKLAEYTPLRQLRSTAPPDPQNGAGGPGAPDTGQTKNEPDSMLEAESCTRSPC
jgi:hypothetical protein